MTDDTFEAAMNDPGGYYSFAGYAAPAKERDRIAEHAQKIAVAQSVVRCGPVGEVKPDYESNTKYEG